MLACPPGAAGLVEAVAAPAFAPLALLEPPGDAAAPSLLAATEADDHKADLSLCGRGRRHTAAMWSK